MTEIIPAILAKDINDLRQKISQFANTSKLIQIDICDGRFVPSISWPMNLDDKESTDKILNEEEGLPYWDTIDFEFDLMVKDAINQFEFFTRLGAKRIIFHIEAESKKDLKEFLEGLDIYIRESLEIGIALNNSTDISEIKEIISLVDFVQCMGIDKIGFQGEPFNEKVLDQIKGLRNEYPEIKISIDGGVNEKTAQLLVDAGANRLVVGSMLMHSYDVRETITDLENL